MRMKRIAVWLAAAALVAVLAGCGGGGDGDGFEGPLESPRYNLTGHWITTEISCDGIFDPIVPQYEADAFLDGIETAAISGRPYQIRQSGNDLEFINTASGARSYGTLSGDAIYAEDRVSLSALRSTFTADVELEGTVLSNNRIASYAVGEYFFNNTSVGTVWCYGTDERY